MDKEILKKKIEELIKESEEATKIKEKEEIEKGVDLYDEPKARLLSKPKLKNGEIVLNLGETSYFKSRRMWSAFPQAVELVKNSGADEEILYELFYYLPGVAALVEKDNKFLVGIRTSNLAGTHIGKLSIPAGLMEKDEEIKVAVLRELKEETGLTGEIEKIAFGENPSAPNITFVCLIKNPKGDVLESYEAKGKKFIWVEKDLILALVFGSGNKKEIERKTIEIFKKVGIETSNNLELAPDIRDGIDKLGLYIVP